MNNNTIMVNMKFQADTKQAEQQMAHLQASLSNIMKLTSATAPGARLATDLNAASNAAAQLKIQLQNAFNINTGRLNLTKFNAELRDSGMTIEKYKTALLSAGPAGQQAFNQLAYSINTAEIPLLSLNKSMQNFLRTLANTARYQLSTSLITGFTSALSEAYNYAQNLNESLNNIRIVTGYSIDEMGKFAEKANKAAKALSATTTEYTNASLIYFQQGLDTAEVEKRTAVTVKMAQVTGQAMEQTSDQLTAVWNNFDNGTKSLEYYADVITALGAATASSSEEITEGLEKFAAVAETVGLSYEYATAALATVTSATRQSADVVGTAFKTLFARLQDLELGETLDDGTTLGTYSKALAAVGVSIKDASGEMRDMDDILDDLAKKWETLSGAEQTALAQTVAGTRQYTQLIALMENWGTMQENLTTAYGSSGALQEQADIYAESWEAARDRVTASLEAIYDSLVNDEVFIDLTNFFADFIGFIDQTTDGIGGLQGAISLVGIALMKYLQQPLHDIVNSSMAWTSAGRREMEMMQEQARAGLMAGYGDNSIGQGQSRAAMTMVATQESFNAYAEKMSETQRQIAQLILDQQHNLAQTAIEQGNVRKETEKTANAQKRLLEAQKSSQGMTLNGVYGKQNPHVNLSDSSARKYYNQLGFSSEDLTVHKDGSVTILNASKATKVRNQNIDTMYMEQQYATKMEAISSNTRIGTDSSYKALSEDYTGTIEQQKKALEDLRRTLELTAQEYNEQIDADDMSKLQEYLTKVKELQQTLIDNDGKLLSDSDLQTLKQASQALDDSSQQHSAQASEAQRAAAALGANVEELEKVKTSAQGAALEMNKQAEANINAARSAEGASEAFAGLEKTIPNLGDTIVATGQAVMSLSMAFSSLKGLWDTWNNEDMSFWDKLLTTFTTLGMAVPMVIAGFKAFNDVKKAGMGDQIKETALRVLNTLAIKKENKARQTGTNSTKAERAEKKKLAEAQKKEIATKNTSLSGSAANLGSALLSALPAILAIAGAIAIIVTVLKIASDRINKLSKEAESASANASLLAEEYGKAQQANEAFKQSMQGYRDGVEGLKDLTKGTIEYREAVLAANEQARQLIESVGDLSYTVDENGLIQISESEQARGQEKLLRQQEEAYGRKILADERADQAQLAVEKEKLLRDNIRSTSGFGAGIGNAAGAGAFGGVAGVALAGALLLSGFLTGGASLGIAAAIGAGAGLVGGGIAAGTTGAASGKEEQALEKILKYYQQENVGNSMFTSPEQFRTILEKELEIDDQTLIDSLVANTDAIKELTEQMDIEAKNDKDQWMQAFISSAGLAGNPDAMILAEEAWQRKESGAFNEGQWSGGTAGQKYDFMTELAKAYGQDFVEQSKVDGHRAVLGKDGFGIRVAGDHFQVRSGEGADWIDITESTAKAMINDNVILRNAAAEYGAGTDKFNQIASQQEKLRLATADTISNEVLREKIIAQAGLDDKKAVELTEDDYLYLLGLDPTKFNQLPDKVKKVIEVSKQQIEKDLPDYIKNSQEEFADWFRGLSEEDREIFISMDFDNDETFETAKTAFERAREWIQKQTIGLRLTNASEGVAYFESGGTAYAESDKYDFIYGQDSEGKNISAAYQKGWEALMGAGVLEKGKHYTEGENGEIQLLAKAFEDYGNIVGDETALLEKLKDTIDATAVETTKIATNTTTTQDVQEVSQNVENATIIADNASTEWANVDPMWQKLVRLTTVPTGDNDTTRKYDLQGAVGNRNAFAKAIMENQDIVNYLNGRYGLDENEKLLHQMFLDWFYGMYSRGRSKNNFTLLDDYINATPGLAEALELDTYGENGPLAYQGTMEELADELGLIDGWEADSDKVFHKLSWLDNIVGEKAITSKLNLFNNAEKTSAEQSIAEKNQQGVINNFNEQQKGIAAVDQGLANMAELYEVNGEQLLFYNEQIEDAAENNEEFNKVLETTPNLQDALATSMAITSNSAKELIDNWDSWTKLIQNGEGTYDEQLKAFDEIEQALKGIFNLNETAELDPAWITQYWNDIATALQTGDFSTIQRAIGELFAPPELQTAAEWDTYFNDILNAEKTFGLSQNSILNESNADFIKWLNEQIKNYNLSAELISQFLNSQQFTIVWDTNNNSISSLIYRGGYKNYAYRPSSSGGSGRSKKDLKVLEDETDRYHEIKELLDDLGREYDRLSKAKDRAFGLSHLDLLDQETEKLDDIISKQEDYIDEINDYLIYDKNKLTEYGASFDDSGRITNYDEMVRVNMEQYNNAVQRYNKGKISDNQMSEYEKEYKEFLDDIAKYEETLNLLESEEENLWDKRNERFDKGLEKAEYVVEFGTGLVEDSLVLIDYQLNKLEDDAYDAAEALSLIGQKMVSTQAQGDVYTSGIEELLGASGLSTEDIINSSPEELSNLIANGVFTTEQIEKLREYRDGLLETNQQMKELADDSLERVNNAFDAWNEKMDEGAEKIEHLTSVTKNYRDIINLIGKDTLGVSDAMLDSLNRATVATSTASLTAAKTQLDANKSALAQAQENLSQAQSETDKKYWEQVVKGLETRVREGEEEVMGAWKDALQAAADAFEDSLDRIGSQFESTVSGMYGTLEALQSAYDQQTQTRDRYLEDYTKIYELSKLTRDITNSIDDTDSIRAKSRLRDIQEEIYALQESGAEMTEYEVNELRARYELRLAEIALEEAQNAKSQVRMSRDSEGNWSYVYIADDDAVSAAAQNYEDKLYAYQSLTQDYIKNLEDQLIQLPNGFKEGMLKIWKDTTLTEEQKEERSRELAEFYAEQYDYILQQLGRTTDDAHNLYQQDWATYSQYTGYKISSEEKWLDSWNETIYAQITGMGSIQQAHNTFANSLTSFVNNTSNAYDTWKNDIKKIMNEAETSISGFSDTLTNAIKDVYDKSEEYSGRINSVAKDMAGEVGELFKEITDIWGKYSSYVSDSAIANEQLATAINNFINQIGSTVNGINQIADSYKGLASAAQAAAASVGKVSGNSSGGSGIDFNGFDNDISQERYYVARPASSVKNGQALPITSMDIKYGRVGWYWHNTLRHYVVAKNYGQNNAQYVIIDEQTLSELKNFGVPEWDTIKNKPKSYDTGGYTGSWDSSGRLAMLHQKEIVLNAHDTENFLSAIHIIRDIAKTIDLNAMAQSGLIGLLRANSIPSQPTILEQEVTIHAEFPNATNHNEIEEAFNSLMNQATQFANRRK